MNWYTSIAGKLLPLLPSHCIEKLLEETQVLHGQPSMSLHQQWQGKVGWQRRLPTTLVVSKSLPQGGHIFMSPMIDNTRCKVPDAEQQRLSVFSLPTI